MRRALITSLAVGVIGAIAMVIGFVVAPTQAAFAYLTAWTFAVSIALGALILLMIGHAAAARWAIVFQPVTERIVRTLPALAILFVPIAVFAGHLYPWVDPHVSDPELADKLAHKAAYLNPLAWTIRAGVFFAIWIAIGELCIRWRRARAKMISSVGMPVIALTLTFAAIDWLMSLTPAWYSTIFGLLYFSGGFVGAMAVIAMVSRQAPAPTGALGRMMFGFLVFWAYMEFSQGIIIWIANKPDEVPWYVARGAEAWGTVFAILVIGHFFAPFFALLSRPLKRNASLLALVAGWLVVMHYVDIYWLVMPVLHPSVSLHWLDLAAPCAVIGLVTVVALLRRPPPLSDAELARAATYGGS